MALNLNDISSLLYLIKLFENEKFASRSYVQQTYNDKPVKQARLPNYKEVESKCNELRLLKIESNKIFLTELGEKILGHCKENNISNKFKEILVKESLIPTELGKKIEKSFSKFHTDEGQHKWCPKWEIYDRFMNPEILPLLYELDVLVKKDITVEINPKYASMFSKSQKKMTLKQLETQLQNWKITGEIAEEIVLKFEINRLKTEGHIKESKKIKIISNDFANAGYDIASFSEHDGNMNEIYIEVKSSIGKEFDFYWSSNELEKAKKYGKKYWIYFISEVDVPSRSSKSEPIRIQNPAETIFKNQSFKIEIEKYHITEVDSS